MSSALLVEQIGRLHIRDVEQHGVGILTVSGGQVISLCRVVKAAHVPADCERFLHVQPNKTLYQPYGGFTVTVGEFIFLNRIIRYLLPLTRRFIFDVARIPNIQIGLAYVMEQGADRNRFLGIGIKTLDT